MTVAVFFGAEGAQKHPAVNMVHSQQKPDGCFRMYPAVAPPMNGKRQNDAAKQGAYAQGCHELKQFFCHDHQPAIFVTFRRRHCQIHIKAGEVKQPGKPGNNEEDMDEFEPEIHFQTGIGRKQHYIVKVCCKQHGGRLSLLECPPHY